MKRLLALFLAFAIAFSMVACQSGPTEAETLHTIETEIFEYYVSTDTLSLHTYFKDPEAAGYTDHVPSLGNWTKEAFDEDIAMYEAWLERLAAINTKKLTEEERLLLEIIQDELTCTVRYKDYYYYHDMFNPMSGYHLNMPIMLSEFKLYREGDIEDYLAVIELFPPLVDELLAFEAEKVPLGLSMSDLMLDEIIEQCEDFLSTRENHDLFASFNEKVDAVEGLTEQQRTAYKEENTRLLNELFFPMYEKIIEDLTALKGLAVANGAYCNYPKGKEYFALEVEDYGMNGVTPQEMYNLMMNGLQRALTRYFEIYEARPNLETEVNAYVLTKGSTEEDLAYLQEIAPLVFPSIPEHTLTVTPFPESLDRSSKLAYYYSPPLDDYTDNVVRVNPDRSGDQNFITTLAHEPYGGHLLDRLYMRENNQSRLIQVLSYSARTEGWAEYASRRLLLAGDYDKEIIEFILLDEELDRYIDAMLVIGIHYLGWDVEKTGDFYAGIYGDGVREYAQDIYNTYLTVPPSYLAYSFGLEIFQELRMEVEAAQGAAFDEVAFHEKILSIGVAPLHIVYRECSIWAGIE